MRLLFALFLYILTAGAQAQQINTVKLDSFFNALESHGKSMGTFAIAKDGKMIYNRSMGFRSVKNDTLYADSLTRYRIGSITKVFTATMIFQLIEEGRLSLDTRLDHFFPNMPNAAEINIGHLLSHSSGLSDYVNDLSNKLWIAGSHSKSEILDTISRKVPHFSPGVKQQYCNSGYFLLASIIEKITGISYPKALNSRIIKKIGLKHTLSGVPNNKGADEASSFGMKGKWTQITDIYFPNVIGVGDILSTPSDLLKFMQALATGQLISETSYTKMHGYSGEDIFGMGLTKVPFYDREGMGHNGATFGTFSMLCSFPSEGISIALSVNGQQYTLNEITVAILTICNAMPFEIPTFLDLRLAPQDIKGYVGVYSNDKLPLKITITGNEFQLQAQATGQSSFPLQPVSANTFRFDGAGIKVVFLPEKKQMTFLQGDKSYTFNKDN